MLSDLNILLESGTTDRLVCSWLNKNINMSIGNGSYYQYNGECCTQKALDAIEKFKVMSIGSWKAFNNEEQFLAIQNISEHCDWTTDGTSSTEPTTSTVTMTTSSTSESTVGTTSISEGREVCSES